MNQIAIGNEQARQSVEQGPAAPAAPRLGEVRAPALVTYGDLDQPAIIEASEYMARHLPGAQKAVIAGTAHLPSLEQPEAFNRLVIGFLQSIQV